MTSSAQRFLRRILPAGAFAALRAETKRWLAECPCGHKRDAWEAGGIRWKAAGKPRRPAHCPACGKVTWHQLRKKTEKEQQEMA